MMGSYCDEELSERIQFTRALQETFRDFHNAFFHVFIYSILLLFSFSVFRVWKAMLSMYYDYDLKWCWSTLTRNNERLPLTSASFRSGLQGRKLRAETSRIYPNAPTQIATADRAGNGEQNLHFWMSFDAHLPCRLPLHTEAIRQGRAKFGAAAKTGCRSWELCPKKWFLLPTGSEIEWEPRTEAGYCHAANWWHRASIRGSFSQPLLGGGRCNPCFRKGESVSCLCPVLCLLWLQPPL